MRQLDKLSSLHEDLCHQVFLITTARMPHRIDGNNTAGVIAQSFTTAGLETFLRPHAIKLSAEQNAHTVFPPNTKQKNDQYQPTNRPILRQVLPVNESTLFILQRLERLRGPRTSPAHQTKNAPKNES